jgi:tetratricopeptide (TPR) repeat protein
MIEDAISFWTEIQRYEDMLAADPNSYCFAPLSELYRKLGLIDDAISVAQKGCALHAEYPGGFFALGAAYFAKGMKGEARQALEQVVALKPDHLQAQKLLGQIFVETGQVELARRALGRILAEDPDDTESALLLRSITPTGPADDLIEDADVIEELTEEPEEPGQARDSGLAEVAQVLSRYEFGAAPQAAAEPKPAAGRHAEPEDLWAIEALDEPEEPAAEPQSRQQPPAAAPQHPSRDPLTTATLAELYVSQGFPEKAAGVYRELLGAEPGNESYRARYVELTRAAQQQEAGAAEPAQGSTAAPVGAAAGDDPEALLAGWLENIRRRRDGV